MGSEVQYLIPTHTFIDEIDCKCIRMGLLCSGETGGAEYTACVARKSSPTAKKRGDARTAASMNTMLLADAIHEPPKTRVKF